MGQRWPQMTKSKTARDADYRMPVKVCHLPATPGKLRKVQTLGSGVVIGPDLEVKDVGDMCHVWRIRVAQATLQPTQRVSKAGIESTAGPY